MKLSVAFCALLAALVPIAAGAPPAPASKVPKGFAYTEATKFKVDGKDFYFAGSNAYYFPFANNETDAYRGMVAAKQAGLKVIRTWGFYDRNATFDPNGLPKYGGEGAGPSEVHFQEWTNGKPKINLSKTGLPVFDGVIRAAEKSGIKLVIALTNNWADYGGMDMYTVNLGYPYHDDFYTKPEIIKHYKNYIKTFINRYKHSPAVFSWQLANEPRCGADGVRNLPRSPTCNTETLTAWIKDISAYIKSIDPHHLVSIGAEGEFKIDGATDGFYTGWDGGDFHTQVGLKNVDYGTFHLYPDWWSKSAEWGTKWVHDHADAQEQLKKPVVFEEYGWLTPEKRLEYLGQVRPETRTEVLTAWQKASVERKLGGDQYWQFGWGGYSYGQNHNDGFTIYLEDPEAKALILDHAKNVESLNKK
ncbi:glycoside hydrolase superfamily [Coprinopsis sp. MPI-PUGE-AT-0042]|nr:glycoside hydrolase superfamily [Coprinopsis sp. MPI-PUGE-AT-0042]